MRQMVTLLAAVALALGVACGPPEPTGAASEGQAVEVDGKATLSEKPIELPLQSVEPVGDGVYTPAADGCRTYYGACTGYWGGTSCAQGEGWQKCYSGRQLYTWMTICGAWGSYPSGWGTGYCLW